MSGQLPFTAAGMPVFAVIDTETSGLSAAKHRLVEVAVCVTDVEFAPLATWHTMINPQSPVTNSRIHGLDDEQLAHAPIFEEIAGTLAGYLDGLRVVAHNASFDARFLNAEYERIDADFCPDPQFAWIDSLAIARQLVPAPHKLASLCTRFQITNPMPHAALGDAIATAHMLARLSQKHAPELGDQLLTTTPAYQSAPYGHLPVQQTPLPRA